MTDRWDQGFLRIALEWAKFSKDPNTRVGALIVGPDREPRSAGFNGFPRGIADDARLHDREVKLRMIVHAERNAICSAARIGVALQGCTLYLAATDDSGMIWGGPPCTACAIELIQAGITSIVSPPLKQGFSKWHADLELSRTVLEEAGVNYRIVP